jgi:hypothetical protein
LSPARHASPSRGVSPARGTSPARRTSPGRGLSPGPSSSRSAGGASASKPNSRQPTPERASRQASSSPSPGRTRNGNSRQQSPARGPTPPGFHSFRRSAAAAATAGRRQAPDPKPQDPGSKLTRGGPGAFSGMQPGFAFAAPVKPSAHKAGAAARIQTREPIASSSSTASGRGAGSRVRSDTSSTRSTGGGSSLVDLTVPYVSKFPKPAKAAAASPQPRSVPWESSLR